MDGIYRGDRGELNFIIIRLRIFEKFECERDWAIVKLRLSWSINQKLRIENRDIDSKSYWIRR